MGRGKAIAGIGLATVVLTVAGGLAALSEPRLTTTAAQEAVTRFARSLPGQVAFARVQVVPLEGRVAIEDLRIAPHGHAGEPTLSVRRVDLRLDRWALLLGRVRLHRVELEAPTLRGRHLGGGRYDWDPLLATGEAPTGEPPVGVEAVRWRSGRIVFVDPPRDATLTVVGLSGGARLGRDLMPEGGRVSASSGVLRRGDVPWVLGNGEVVFQRAGDALHLSRARLDAAGATWTGQGTVGLTAAGNLALQGGLRVSLGRLPAWPELATWRPEGELEADWVVRGTAPVPDLGVRLRGSDLRLREARFPMLRAEFRADGSRVEVARALLEHQGAGRLELAGSLPLTATSPLEATLALDGVEAPRVASELGFEMPAGVSGRVSARLRAAGRGLAPLAWRVAGTISGAGRLPAPGGPEPVAAQASLRWQDRRLDVTSFDVSAIGGRLTGRAAAELPTRGEPTWRLAGRGEALDLARAARAGAATVMVEGRLATTFELSGMGTALTGVTGAGRASARGHVPAEVAAAVAPIPLTADGGWTLAQGRLTLEGFEARLFDGRARVSGHVPLQDPAGASRLQVRVAGLDVPALARAYDAPAGFPRSRATAELRMVGQALTIERAEVPLWGGRVRVDGSAALSSPASYSMRIQAAGLGLDGLRRSFWPSGAALRGQADARFSLAGRGAAYTLAGPVAARGEARIADAQVPGAARVVPLSLAGSVRLTPGGLSTPSLALGLAEGRLTLRGRLDRTGASDLAVEASVPALGPVADLVGVADVTGGPFHLTGTARGPRGAVALEARMAADSVGRSSMSLTNVLGRASGRWGERLSLAGRLDGAARQGERLASRAWQLPFRYDAPARQASAGVLTVPGFDVRLGGGRLTGRAVWDRARGVVDGALHSEALTVADVLPDGVASPAAVPGTTPLAVAVQARGPIGNPTGDGVVMLGAFKREGEAYGPSRVALRTSPGGLDVEGRLFGGSALLDGRVPPGNAPGRLRLLLKELRMAPLLSAIPAAWRRELQWPVAGELAGTVEVTGPLRRPKDTRVVVALDRFGLTWPDLRIANRGPWRFSYADRMLHLDTFRLAGGGTNLSAHGTLGLGRPSNVAVEGRLDLALLEKLAPRQFAGATGRARLEGSLRGRLGAADLAGALTLRDGELETRGLPQPIHDLTASIRLASDRVFLDHLRAGFGQAGRLSAVGGARLEQDGTLGGLTLQLDAQELALRFSGVEAVTNADLSYAWARSGGRLDGQVRVLEGLYSQDVALTPGAGRARAKPSAAMSSPFVRDTAMRVQVLLPDGFRVRNNVLNGEVRGDMVVLGTPAEPVLVGRAEARDATITFQDREFAAREATVDFIDPRVLTPYVHLNAGSTIEGVDVQVRANGTPDRLRLELSSTPAMSQTDILTLIATGKTGKELGEAATGGLAGASNVLLDRVAGGVARGITEQGVVDVLKVKPGSVDPASPGGASFTVGKRINEKLTITYSQDITSAPGRPQGRTMIFDYLLTDAIVLKLEQDLGGGFNASARYRLPVR